jgi:hypothetical protein
MVFLGKHVLFHDRRLLLTEDDIQLADVPWVIVVRRDGEGATRGRLKASASAARYANMFPSRARPGKEQRGFIIFSVEERELVFRERRLERCQVACAVREGCLVE